MGHSFSLRGSDLLFAELVVEQRLCSAERVSECVAALERFARSGISPMPSLGELLVQRGYLTPPQVQETMRLGKLSLTTSQESEIPSEASGDRVGKYVKARKLGEGGMGEVWKAWDSELRRWVAMKFLKHDDAEELARFKREAQTAGNLNHPNIAAIHEVGDVAGRHFIAMQYVEGQTLSTFPRQDTKLLVELVRDAALAVHAAHEEGVIHRDLKPENLMVEGKSRPTSTTTRRAPGPRRPSGLRLYVMDFGLAKSMAVTSSLSVSGTIVGTPAYMSPEQARASRELDPRTDVYSLGATLYEVLTDRPPFRDGDVYGLLKRVVEEDPPAVRKIKPRVEPDLETIVMKCLEKDPARRYATALELADDLSRWLAGEAILAHPPSMMYSLRKLAARRRAVLGMGLAGMVAVAVVAAILARRWMGERTGRKAAEETGALEREGKEKAEREKEIERAGKARAEREREAMEVYKNAELDLHALRMRSYRADWRLTEEEFKKYDQLIETCREQMGRTGPSADGWWVIGRAKHAIGNWRSALDAYDEGLKARSDHGSCLLYKARLLIERALRDRHSPGTERKAAAESKINEALTLLSLALASGQIGELEIDLAKGYEIVVKGQMIWRVIENKYQNYFEQMLEKWKNADFREEFYLMRGLAHDAKMHLIEGATEAIRARPAFYEAYLWRGNGHMWEGDLSGALKDYDTAIAINPRYVDAYTYRGGARYQKGDIHGAIEDWTKAHDIDPRDGDVIANRGTARKDNRDLNGALEDYATAMEVDPRCALAYLGRGTIRFESRDLDGAIDDWTMAVQINPTFAEAYYNRASAKHAKSDLGGAIDDWTKAIEFDPRLTLAYVNRGSARATQGDLAGAIEDWTKAIELDPKQPEPYVKRGGVRLLLALRENSPERQGLENAAADLEKALQLGGPSWPHRAQAQTILQQVHESLKQLGSQDPRTDVSSLIEKLRSDKIEERDAAARELEALDEKAEAELDKATKDRDPEVARRARDILGRLTFKERILATMPESVVRKELASEWRVIFSHDGRNVAYWELFNVNPTLFADGREYHGYSSIWPVVFSADSRTLAFAARLEKGGQVVIMGGRQSEEYDEVVGDLVFSEDGRHLAYSARKAKKAFVVLDGAKGKEYDDVTVPSLTPDGNVLAYGARKEKKWFLIVGGEKREIKGSNLHSVTVSPDGKTLAYQAGSGEKNMFIVVGEQKGEEFEWAGWQKFGPDGKTIAYVALKNRHWLAILGDRKGPEFRTLQLPSFAPDGKSLVYAARKEDRKEVLWAGDEAKSAEFDEVHFYCFTADGKTPVYSARKGEKSRVVIGDKTDPEFDDIGEVAPSPLGGTVAYAANIGGKRDEHKNIKGGKWIVVAGNERSAEYDEVHELRFSLDGKRVAFGARKGRDLLWRVMAVK